MTSLTQQSVDNTQKGLADGGVPKAQGANQQPPATPPGSATEQALMSAERLLGIKIIRQVNDEGRVTFILATNNGQKLDFDEKGNVFIGAAKIGDSEDGGNVTLRAWGDLNLKLGNKLNIEVENFLNEEKPVSIKVGGDCNIESTDGHLALKGKNVTVRATTDLNLIGQKVKIMGGNNKGGAVSIESNTFKTDTTFINNTVTGGWTQKVTGEYTIRQMLDPRSIFTLNTAGHAKYKVQGDCSWDVLGKMGVNIMGIPPKPVPTAPQMETLSVHVMKGDTKFISTAGNHTSTFTAGNVTNTITAGNLTETITGNHTETITKKLTQTVTDDVTQTWSKNLTRIVSGNETQQITGFSTNTVQGNYTLATSGIGTITATKNLIMYGKMIMLN
jgi:hypothetical protein|tara:strand:- start:162 stop:1325 length:1164 start_codon:yes stop_codon:yes gene_type:complete